jgi:DNA repair protein SbcD/Mre11
MKLLHTADWHIGQLFHEYDRTLEHQLFLDWLLEILHQEKIDVLLISGDVFDFANPPANSVKQFYQFLNQATRQNPNLQIIVTAGNHDSAARLESPKPLLESSNIHIVGVVEKDSDGNIVYDGLILPLKDETGTIKAWCIAVPFLRVGDYPLVAGSQNPYADGVTLFYERAYECALRKKQAGQAIIAKGHLHALQAEISDMDKQERLIMGGIECISAASFSSDIAYVALGHIHKAQKIGGKEHIRYCGSPLPMSFSERNYKHQVIVFEIENENAKNIHSLEIPLAVPVQSVPSAHSSIEEVLKELAKLPDAKETMELAPYLEVRVLEDQPDPNRRYKIEQAITGKYVRLATINVKSANNVNKETRSSIQPKLDELTPADIFSKIYISTYGNAVPVDMLQLFNQVADEVAQREGEP